MQAVFDFHTHIFPEKIAAKAASGICEFYDFPKDNLKKGTKEDLLSGLKCGVIGKALCFSVATVPKQVPSINDFLVSAVSDTDALIAYGAMHPFYDDIENEMERIKSLGLLGVKLHPDLQKFNIDDSAAFPIYESAQRLSLPVYFHSGDDRYDFSSPYRIAKIMEKFPRLKVVAAHLGGYRRWKDASKCLFGSGALYDTSSAVCFMSPEQAYEQIMGCGVDNVLFGTDYPLKSPCEEVALINAIPLSFEDKQKIFYKNAEKFFGIKVCDENEKR